MKKWIGLIACLVVGCAVAQPVYRCGNTFSHEPCLGAEEVQITVPEGIDTLSGKRRVATDLEIDRMFRSDKTPIFGIDLRPTHGSWEDRKRRSRNNLTDSQVRACTELRQKILEVSKDAHDPKELYMLRLQYREDGY